VFLSLDFSWTLMYVHMGSTVDQMNTQLDLRKTDLRRTSRNVTVVCGLCV